MSHRPPCETPVPPFQHSNSSFLPVIRPRAAHFFPLASWTPISLSLTREAPISPLCVRVLPMPLRPCPRARHFHLSAFGAPSPPCPPPKSSQASLQYSEAAIPPTHRPEGPSLLSVSVLSLNSSQFSAWAVFVSTLLDRLTSSAPGRYLPPF